MDVQTKLWVRACVPGQREVDRKELSGSTVDVLKLCTWLVVVYYKLKTNPWVARACVSLTTGDGKSLSGQCLRRSDTTKEGRGSGRNWYNVLLCLH